MKREIGGGNFTLEEEPTLETGSNNVMKYMGRRTIEIEEVKSTGFKCFDEGGEKIYRIWARIRKEDEMIVHCFPGRRLYIGGGV